MMIKKDLIQIIFILLMGVQLLFPQSKYGGTIFNAAKDPGGEALGGAVVAAENGVYSVLYNPAALVYNENITVGFIHTELFISDISYNFIGGSFKYRNNHVGVALVRLGVDNIKTFTGSIYDYAWYKVNSINVADYLFLVGLAPSRPGSKFQYGINAKYLYRAYDIETASGVGFDIGALFQYNNYLRFGARVNNVFGSVILYSTGKKEWIRPEVSYGLEYNRNIFQKFSGAVYLNIFHYLDNRQSSATANLGIISADVGLGLKIDYGNLFSISLGKDQVNNFTFGAGISIPKIRIKYARVQHPDLGDLQNIGVNFILPY